MMAGRFCAPVPFQVHLVAIWQERGRVARCKDREMIRAFKMRLEYGMGPEFEKRHAEVWPEVERMIHEYGGR